jgi:hypothetical protein
MTDILVVQQFETSSELLFLLAKKKQNPTASLSVNLAPETPCLFKATKKVEKGGVECFLFHRGQVS